MQQLSLYFSLQLKNVGRAVALNTMDQQKAYDAGFFFYWASIPLPINSLGIGPFE